MSATVISLAATITMVLFASKAGSVIGKAESMMILWENIRTSIAKLSFPFTSLHHPASCFSTEPWIDSLIFFRQMWDRRPSRRAPSVGLNCPSRSSRVLNFTCTQGSRRECLTRRHKTANYPQLQRRRSSTRLTSASMRKSTRRLFKSSQRSTTRALLLSFHTSQVFQCALR